MPLMLIPITNSINYVQKMKHYILQQIVDEYTALTNNFYACIHVLKKVIAKILNAFRPLAWHSVLQVNLFCTLLNNVNYGN